ncbi:FAD/NAD(P)-binding protein [Actinokineospora bangkokensis]|uniref:Adenylate cyclase n=1 Tax=Actinokineospora bangkokensis TaxID=1193682 RepID=A0A1Q9LJ19_9PSEU|nr:FAD/NAD(P)-binding protein [Actinokineospora bangkokensis]OLR91994.1 adenylate cyclase [Actinokineospora bangkokensis]
MDQRVSVAVVGAGPSGVGLVERIAASAPELFPTGHLTVHLVDPHPPGAGRVWRYDQSPLLWMNSMPEDVTMFLDESVTAEGPVRPGPTLAAWAARVRGSGGDGVPEDLREEFAASTPTKFPSRRLQSAYLDWFFRDALAALPSNVDVVVHEDTAVDVTGGHGGPQSVWLAEGAEPLVVDVVVMAVGHLDVAPTPGQLALAEYAAEHDLRYVPPAYTSDIDLSALQPGEDVLVRGFGLAFIDLMALVTEGRGGRFEQVDGTLVYHPSGKEPHLHIGSRRGVPYHAKPGYRLQGEFAGPPRFFDVAAVERLTAREERVDFWRDMWPLVAKDVAWCYYTELYSAHGERTALPFEEFERRFAAADWGSAELRALVVEAVPAEEDRFDPERLDKPLAGLTFADEAELTEHLHAYVRADIARRADPAHSADMGAFLGLLFAFAQIARVVASGRLTDDALIDDVDTWWFGFFSYFASGPPAPRLEQLLALSRAGVVSFVGPDMWVRADGGRFTAGSPAVPGERTATALVEARLPRPSVARATDPLIVALRDRGELVEESLPGGRTTGRITTRTSGALVERDGTAHPRRIALGPHTSIRAAAAFSRPHTNAPGFRRNDRVARTILRTLHAGGPITIDT